MTINRDGQRPDSYQGLNPVQNPPIIKATRAPATGDRRYKIGTTWINTSANTAYFLTSVVAGSATWALASPGASDVDTLTGDGGGAISPAGGNITLAGGTNITTAGAGSTITFNLDAAISLATSVTSPLYTVAAATDLAITAVAGQDIILTMGDAAGANKVSFLDSAAAEVAAIDSNGGFSMGALTFTGLLTASASATIDTAGTALNLATDNSGDDVNIAIGTVARDVHIADSAAAHTVTIGSTTGAASLDLQFGTGNFTLDGPATGTILIGDSITSGTVTIGGTAQTGNYILAPSTAGLTVTLANNNGAKVVNIANGVDGNTVSIANGINTSAQTVNIAGGAAAANSTVNVLSGVATAGTQTLNLGTGASAKSVNIGNSTGASAVAIDSGTGNVAITSTGATADVTASAGQDLLLDAVGVLEINSSAGVIGIGNDAVAQNINIGTGAAARTITFGNITGATNVVFNSGTGGFAFNPTGAGDITFNVTAGNYAVVGGGNSIGIGDDAAANTVTVGSTTGAAATVIQAGTGDITFTGTVKEINSEFLFSSGTDLTVTQSPIMQSNANTGAAPTGVNGDVNLMYLQDGCLMEQFIIGTQTIIAPRMNANGLNLALDNTAAEGSEYNFGARNNAKHAYTIGTSAAFFIEATIYVEDYSACDPLMVGFRKVEANNATLASYTDYACIGINQATSAANATILSELNSGGQTATNTTDALAAEPNSFSVKVLVSAAGVVTFEVDGSAASVAPSYTFDNGDVVMPFIHFLQGADVTTDVDLQNLKIGFQA